MNPPVLAHYESGKPVGLHTDASGIGLGVVGVKKYPEGPVVAYGSRSSSKIEKIILPLNESAWQLIRVV